jgi:hypothetical protein
MRERDMRSAWVQGRESQVGIFAIPPSIKIEGRGGERVNKRERKIRVKEM